MTPVLPKWRGNDLVKTRSSIEGKEIIDLFWNRD
jgi:hypothetical protein